MFLVVDDSFVMKNVWIMEWIFYKFWMRILKVFNLYNNYYNLTCFIVHKANYFTFIEFHKKINKQIVEV